MRWQAALQALLDDLGADTALTALPGFRLLRRGEMTEHYVPSVAWSVFSDRLEENTNPVEVQFDYFARGIDQALTIERRLRARHHDLPQTIRGVRMWITYDDARDHEDPEIGVVHRSLDFLLTPARET